MPNRTLTLGEREEIHGRMLRQWDADGMTWFCVDCLSDLPPIGYGQVLHVCPEIGQEPWREVELPPAEHKTKTFCPMTETGRFTKRGRPLYDRSAVAWCTCGWKAWERDRPAVRRLARAHRENPEG